MNTIKTIKKTIKVTLLEAKKNFLKDNLFNDEKISHRMVSEQLDFLCESYIKELDAHNFVYKNKIKLADNRKKIEKVELDGKKFEIYIVMAISAGVDDRVVLRGLRSIVNNFTFTNYCIVLVVNSDFKNFDFLLSKKIKHFVLRNENCLSLPDSYNLAIHQIKLIQGKKNALICFIDDDAYIIGKQQKTIKENMAMVKDGKFLAVSGHCYDKRNLKNIFFKSVKESHRSDFTNKVLKPYCHGGALMMMNLRDYPFGGLIPEGLGGVSLAIKLIHNISEKKAKLMLSNDDWYLFNNPKLKIFHPLKENILRWTATYLSYGVGWENSLNDLKTPYKEIWQEKIELSASKRMDKLIARYINNQTNLNILGNIFLTGYYKPLIKERFTYESFRNIGASRHINLK